MRFPLFFTLFFLLFHSPITSAEAPIYGDPVQDAVIVGASAIGGAILGLSTLPFTEEPGDHLDNVLVGGAIGLVIGVAFVAYSQASVTQSSYAISRSTYKNDNRVTFPRQRSASSYNLATGKKGKASPLIPQVGYSFSF